MRNHAPKTSHLIAAGALALASFAQTPAPRQPNDYVATLAVSLTASRDVVYKKTADRELKLHLFNPEGWKASDRRACFVTTHGGGWTGGEPKRMYPFADHYSKLGLVGISVLWYAG